MGLNPKHKKTSQAYKTLHKNTSKKNSLKEFLDSIPLEEFIIEQLSKGISPNEICRTIQTLWRIEAYSSKIRKTLFKYWVKIKRINKKFDYIACKKIHLVSLDEIYKGRKITILVMIDAVTGYIICMIKIKNRKAKTIINALQPYKDLLSHVDLALTDGAIYFPEVIKSIFPNARHQICLVHVLRNLFKKLEPYQKKYRKAQGKVSKMIKKIHHIEDMMEIRSYNRKLIKQKYEYWKNRRVKLRNKLGVKANEKGILKKYPELKEINLEINSLSSELRSVDNTLKNSRNKLKKLKKKLEPLKKARDLKWGDYMVQYRMLYRFYNIFKLHSSKYRIAHGNLIVTVTQPSVSDFYKEIHRVLTKTVHLDTVNMDDCPVRLDRNFINTNAIESINSQLRPFLDRLKKIGDTRYMRAIFDLIKLRLNTTPPFSGNRTDTAPIERYGYDLRNWTFIDLIFRGLPPGPQYGLLCSQIDLHVANPNMVGKVKIPSIL